MANEQLALSVQLPDDETFNSFYQGEAVTIKEQLQAFITPKASSTSLPNSFYLFGLSGVGKSHLLHACCSYAEEHGLSSLCLSLTDLSQLSVEMLEGLEHLDLICLDDINAIAGNTQWEQGVFDLFNRLIEQDKKILVAANDSVKQINFVLPDLVSRLTWGYTEQIKPLQDEDKLNILQYRAAERGLSLSLDVAKFLLNRSSREMTDLVQALDLLDKASIKEQRKITIPFIKSTLSLT